MTATSYFMLRLIGPVLLVVGLSVVLNTPLYKKMLKNFGDFTIEYFLAAVAPLAIGVAILLHHNTWDTPPEVVLSIVGWGALIKGVIRLLFPDVAKNMVRNVAKGHLNVWGLIVLLVGVYMCWLGYAI